MSGRPLDVLEEALDSEVIVTLKSGESFVGALAGYDQHLNVVLEPGAGDIDVEGDGDGFEAVRDTTVIRGDNVVTIQP